MKQGEQDHQKQSVARLSPGDLAGAALALVLGLGIGWIDLHVTEVAATILALLAAGFLLGLLRPVAAWRWAVLMALGLPIMAAVAVGSGAQTAEPAGVDIRIALAALAFVLLGTYGGVLARYTVRALTRRPH